MTIGKILLATGMAAVLLTSAPAYAGENKDHDKYAAIANAKLSMGQAIEAAQRNTPGDAFAGEFELDDGKGVYEVKIAKGDGVTEVKIDAASGEILSTESEGLLGKLEKRIESFFGEKGKATGGIGLAQAVNAAEQSTQGKAVEAEVEEEREDTYAYEIKLVKDGWRKAVMVDAKTGQFIQE